MSTEIDPPNPEPSQLSIGLSRSPQLLGTSPSGSPLTYRMINGSRLTSSVWIPTAPSAASYSPSLSSVSSLGRQSPPLLLPPPAQSPSSRRRVRAASLRSPRPPTGSCGSPRLSPRSPRTGGRKVVQDPAITAQARSALELNDAMVYLEGPQIYACQQCRTHLTSHDDIISKSFHGRRGRAYLFDQCVNVRIGVPEDRLLITGLHSVADMFCQRCSTLVGWTYKRAYEASQKYKEGKFIIEKINLYLEEADTYDIPPPAGERRDRWRQRSMSWGSEDASSTAASMVYEYAS